MTFNTIARKVTDAVGSPISSVIAVVVIVLWALTGPIFGFSDTWQLVINTGTTIVTFLMVFIIQSTQNRNEAAINAKLDEIVRSIDEAHDDVIGLEKKE